MFNHPGFLTYLQGMGYGGDTRPEYRQFMQGLRQDGQHPRMDYRQSMGFQPQFGQPQGLGGLAGMQNFGGQMGHQFQNPGMSEPRPMNTGIVPPHMNTNMQGGGLMSLARKPMKFGLR